MPDVPITAQNAQPLDFTMDVPGSNTAARSAMFQTQMQQLLNNDKKLSEDAAADATALADHIADATDAHDASAISYPPSGTILSSNVGAAIAELDAEKATVGSVAAVDARLNSGGDIDLRIDALELISPGLRYYEGFISRNFANSSDPFTGADVGASRNLFWCPVVIPAGKILKIKRVLASKVGNSDRTTELQILCSNSRVVGGGSTSGAANTTFTKSSVTNGAKDIDDSPNHTVYSNPTANPILVDFICQFVVIPTGGGGTIGDNNPQGFVEVTTKIE